MVSDRNRPPSPETALYRDRGRQARKGERRDQSGSNESSPERLERYTKFSRQVPDSSPKPLDQQEPQGLEVPVHVEEQQDTDKPSPLDKIKTLPELLELIPHEYRDIVTRADQRATKAIDTAINREKKSPEELVNLVKEYYDVTPYKKDLRLEYLFESKKHKDDNRMLIKIDQGKGIMSSWLGWRKYKDEIYISDLQRFACITNDWKEIPINEYDSQSANNDNTLKIASALYYANNKLRSDTATDPWSDRTLKLTEESAAFKVFLGTDIHLSKIFLARDLGRRIQSVTIENATGRTISSQLKFVPDERSLELR